MRDENLRESTNIEDRRGGDDNSGLGGLGGGLGGGFSSGGIPIRTGGGLGFVIVVLLMLFFGGGKNLLANLPADNSGYSQNGYQAQDSGGANNGATGLNTAHDRTPEEARTAKRIARVLGSTEDFWGTYFKQNGGTYTPPTLVIFDDHTTSECGQASQSSGPFYCPNDGKVYLDMAFFNEMRDSLGANGDFAEAYVVAHEIGHRVQDEMGILSKAHRAMARSGEDKGADSLSVKIELQADCFAGVWAKNAIADAGNLEQGDVQEAMNAAEAVGDDRLQKRAQGYAVPDSFTHGTSAQREKWFNAGMSAGNPNVCDTFNAKNL